MTLRVETTTGVYNTPVTSSQDAARVLMALHRLGIKCTRWEVR